MPPAPPRSDSLDVGWEPFGEAIVQAYRKYNKDPAAALAQVGVDLARRRAEQTRMTVEQYLSLATYTMRELDDEALGWFSRPMPWGVHSMLMGRSFSAPTLQVALQRRIRHHNFMIDDIKLGLGVGDGIATIRIDEGQAAWTHESLRRMCLFSMLMGVFGNACWLADSRIAVVDMALPFAAPPSGDDFSTLLGRPVRFSAGLAAISFDSRYLKLPVLRGEADMRTLLRQPLDLTVYRYRRDRMLVDRVRDLLRRRSDVPVTAETVADTLNVSLRTLHRQLQEEGASLQRLKTEVRQSKATHLLRHSDLPIKQVAAATGFRNDKSFARAFKDWTGETPAAFAARTRRRSP
jgi:AraC-like DNA-binding protein